MCPKERIKKMCDTSDYIFINLYLVNIFLLAN